MINNNYFTRNYIESNTEKQNSTSFLRIYSARYIFILLIIKNSNKYNAAREFSKTKKFIAK